MLAYRAKFLHEFGKKETLAKFLAQQQAQPSGEVDWDAIVAQEQHEINEEKRRGGGGGGGRK